MSINYDRLLLSILENQEDADIGLAIAENRLFQIATGKETPTLREQAILLRSRELRRKIARIAEENANQPQAISDYDLRIFPLAAASGRLNELCLEHKHFSVRLYRNRSGQGMIVQLNLSQHLLSDMQIASSVRLVDSGGSTWLQGTPDDNGELIGMWVDGDVDLIKRAYQYELLLKIG